MLYLGLRYLYLAALLITCAYAFRAGGRSEKQGGAIMLLCSLLTVPAMWIPGSAGWISGQMGILVVDLVGLAGLLTLALRTDRYWPLWAAGFHLDAVITHCAKLLAPAIVPQAYSLSQGFWAYPMLAALAIGTRQHQSRQRKAALVKTGPATPF